MVEVPARSTRRRRARSHILHFLQARLDGWRKRSNRLSNDAAPSGKAPQELLWLHDAPLFIDRKQVEAFFDAIVRPKGRLEETTLTLSTERVREISAAMEIEGGLEVGDLAALLTGLVGFKPSLKGTGGGDLTDTRSEGQGFESTIREISTPERQLSLLVGHYLLNHPNRLFLPGPVALARWRKPEVIASVPRALVFLDLPSRDEAARDSLPRTKFIPMAAEFADGTVDPLFTKILAQNGERSPEYPDESEKTRTPAEYQSYWKWFDRHFSARRMMEIIENAATSHGGRISWIDYRVPLTAEGDTLHLHIAPNADYDTGVFAYNLIKRGYAHGMRLVGTLKSGPDMNVLAIYEK